MALGVIDYNNKRERVPITKSNVEHKSKRAFVGQISISSSDR